MSTKQDPDSFDLEPGVMVITDEVAAGIITELIDHERADLAERFNEMCGTCGLVQATRSVIKRLFEEHNTPDAKPRLI